MVYYLTIAVRIVMVSLPLSLARRVGAFFGSVAYYLVQLDRQRILENLQLAYGNELSDARRREITRGVFRTAGMGVAEAAYVSSGRVDQVLQGMRVEGMDEVREVIAQGRGIVMVTAHFGNWELGVVPFVRSLPCEVGVVARELSNPHLEQLLLQQRVRCGEKVFLRGKTGRDYVRFLRSGNMLGVVGDMDTTRGEGIFVNFFGRPAWTQTGIGRLARMGRARVFTAFASFDPTDPSRSCLEIKPLPEPVTKDETEWIAEITQAFTDRIEDIVRRYPEQWMWMHRRWRHRPEDGPPRMRVDA
jgi:KDO2-lipid IV(A) lauroyltransferase